MKSYETYTVDDFIDDPDFRDWAQGHSERESFWLSFRQQYPHQQAAFEQAERFVRAVQVAPETLSDSEVRKEVERFLETSLTYKVHRRPINTAVPPRYRRPLPLLRRSRLSKSVVALVLTAVVAGAGYWWSNRPGSPPGHPLSHHVDQPVTEPLVETTNHTKHLLRVVLTDGSEVLLSPNSQLRYPSQFLGKTRPVYLRGEAVFRVRRQPNPFMVYSGDLITKVLGTRFVVRAFDGDRRSSVQVLSGKVSVYGRKAGETGSMQKEVKGLILTANQAAVFGRADGDLTKTLVANPTPIEPVAARPSFVYDEIPLPAIIREIEQAYGISIQFDAQAFADSRITAVLSDESLYEKLNLLCKAASATYEITDGQIVISRKTN